MEVKEITPWELDELIHSGAKVVVDFWSPTCSPCKTMAFMFRDAIDKLGDRVEDFKFFELNVAQNRDYARSLGVSHVPTMMGFSGGKKVLHDIGLKSSKDIVTLIEYSFSL